LLGRTQPIKRIILLCTNHEVSNSFISTSYNDILSYNTNTNTDTTNTDTTTNNKSLLKIDTNTIEYLKPYLKIDNNRFNNEHSFFNQLPFIEYIISQSSSLNAIKQEPIIKNDKSNKTDKHPNKNVLLLPFLISNTINLLDENIRNNIRYILHTIIELLKNNDTILICTSDLSHINGHFETKINSNIYQNIRKKDNEILQFLYNGVNGLNERNQKIDDILFIANAPSCGTLAIYFFAKILHNYSGSLDYSSSSSSSSNSSGSKSPTTIHNINNINWINKKEIKENKEINTLNQLVPRLCCYYTSLMRNKINIYNFNPLELNTVLDITDNRESSVSYAGIIFTTQHYIESNKIKKIKNILSEYEKIANKGIVK
jgi:predicted class III extradiol MEMO1 family dioxygenase